MGYPKSTKRIRSRSPVVRKTLYFRQGNPQNGALFLKNLPKYCKGYWHRFEGFPAREKGVFRTTGDLGEIFFEDYVYPMVTLNFQIYFKIGNSSL